jgi:hypothetical protein
VTAAMASLNAASFPQRVYVDADASTVDLPSAPAFSKTSSPSLALPCVQLAHNEDGLGELAKSVFMLWVLHARKGERGRG